MNLRLCYTGGGYAEVKAGLGLSLRIGSDPAEVLPHAVWAEIGLSLRKCAEANRRALELASPDPGSPLLATPDGSPIACVFGPVPPYAQRPPWSYFRTKLSRADT